MPSTAATNEATTFSQLALARLSRGIPPPKSSDTQQTYRRHRFYSMNTQPLSSQRCGGPGSPDETVSISSRLTSNHENVPQHVIRAPTGASGSTTSIFSLLSYYMRQYERYKMTCNTPRFNQKNASEQVGEIAPLLLLVPPFARIRVAMQLHGYTRSGSSAVVQIRWLC